MQNSYVATMSVDSQALTRDFCPAEIPHKLYAKHLSSHARVSYIAATDDYYNPAFHFCRPEGGPKKEPESLGSILFGDRIFNSPYDVRRLSFIRAPRCSCHLGAHAAG